MWLELSLKNKTTIKHLCVWGRIGTQHRNHIVTLLKSVHTDIRHYKRSLRLLELFSDSKPDRLHWCTYPKILCSSEFRLTLLVPALLLGLCLSPCIWGHMGFRGHCPPAATHGSDLGSAHRRGLNTAEHGNLRNLVGSPEKGVISIRGKKDIWYIFEHNLTVSFTF